MCWSYSTQIQVIEQVEIVQCSWHQQKHYLLEERKIGLSNCIIVEGYLHNYRATVTAAHRVGYQALQVVIYPCASHSFEWKTVGGSPYAFHIIADILSNYHWKFLILILCKNMAYFFLYWTVLAEPFKYRELSCLLTFSLKLCIIFIVQGICEEGKQQQ